MAETRTIIDPFGGTFYVDTEDEEYIDPFGGTIAGDIEAAAAGGLPAGSLSLLGTGT